MRAHRAALVFVSAVLAGAEGVVAQRQPQTTIDFSVIGEDGRPITELKATEVTPVALAPGATDDSRVAYGGFAIDAPPPGDVVVGALVSIDGKLTGRVVHTLRKIK